MSLDGVVFVVPQPDYPPPVIHRPSFPSSSPPFTFHLPHPILPTSSLSPSHPLILPSPTYPLILQNPTSHLPIFPSPISLPFHIASLPCSPSPSPLNVKCQPNQLIPYITQHLTSTPGSPPLGPPPSFTPFLIFVTILTWFRSYTPLKSHSGHGSARAM